MDPVTLAIAALSAVAGGITSGATAKIGEPLGQGLINAAQKWLAQLRQHSPETVKRLATVNDRRWVWAA